MPGGADPQALEERGADGEVRTLFSAGRLAFYYLMAVIGGMLWFIQFIFYELGHADMGNFKFISWGIYMAMGGTPASSLPNRIKNSLPTVSRFPNGFYASLGIPGKWSKWASRE